MEEIVKGIKALAPNSGKGESDNESSIFIETADVLGKPLTDLFNLILKTGINPNKWKCTHITLIFKGGKKNGPWELSPYIHPITNFQTFRVISPHQNH